MQITVTIPNPQIIPFAILPTTEACETQEDRANLWEVGPQQHVQTHLISLINRAQEMICVQSFIIDDNPVVDALTQAADRGVAVFLTGATVKLSPPEEEPEFRTEAYKKLLETKIKGRILFRAADHFHAKFLLVDPHRQPMGVLLTANLTTKALTRNPELAVPLAIEQAQALYQQFRYHFWEEAVQEHTPRRDFAALKPQARFTLAADQGSMLCTRQQADPQLLRNALLTTIEQAQTEISLSTYNLDPTHPVAQAILARAEAGVKVTLFFPERAHKIKDACEPFLKAGAEVFIQPYLHAKALLVDGEAGFMFSANIEQYGLDQGWEAGLRLKDDQVASLRACFEQWQSSFGRLRQNLAVADHLGQLTVLNGEAKQEVIQAEISSAKTLSPPTLRAVREALEKLAPQPYAQRTTHQLTVRFPAPPAKFEKKHELIPGLWEIERPGKKGKAPRPALLIEKALDWDQVIAAVSDEQTQWNCYAND